jgi:hypothetical protein
LNRGGEFIGPFNPGFSINPGSSMSRRAFYAMLAIVALLLQTTMSTHAFKPKTAGIAADCVSTQTALELGASVQKSGGDAGHARNHWRHQCLPCATSASLPAPGPIVIAIVVTKISAPPIYADDFETRSGVRIDLNAPPTAPPALS